jgi:DNA-directed RNA polymerase subunit RPC12/RpoP
LADGSLLSIFKGVDMNTLESMAGRDTAALVTKESDVADCIRCSGERAVYEYWQTADDGQLNEHWSIHCPDCGFKDTDAMSAMQNNPCLPA